MAKRRTDDQKKTLERLEATYITRNRVGKRDLAVTEKPDLFHAKKPDRHFNNCVDHANKDLKLLYFMFNHLKPHYRLKILQGRELQNFLTHVLDLTSKFNEYNKQELELVNAFALQTLSYSANTLGRTMPPEFRKLFNDLVRPLNDLLEAIYENTRKNNKKMEQFHKIGLPELPELRTTHS